MKKYLVLLLLIGLFQPSSIYGQLGRKKLEAKRLELKKEIEEINSRLKKIRQIRTNELEILNTINRKINIRNELIFNLSQEINQLTKKIRQTSKEISKLEKDLNLLKKNYAEMIRQAYKSRSRNSKLYFLLSAENFQQAFKRMQYLKQYSNYRKQQVLEIQQKKEKLEKLNQELKNNKKKKEKLYSEYQLEKEKILSEKKAQQREVEKIKKKKSYYLTLIRKKEREKRKIDRLIEAEIQKAIVKSNRKNVKTIKKATSKSKFFMTPDAKKLATQFSQNRGLLPWPVKKAYISRHYGIQQHKVFKNVKINNSGINLATSKGAKVFSVFKGKVLQIQIIPGGNTTVYIKHGNYLTIYQNLKEVWVKPGENVKTGQPIGIAATDPTTGKTEIKFLIYKNLIKLNPENWLLKK